MGVNCRKCGKHVTEVKGVLSRVNPKGEVPAVWECRPSCDAEMSQEEAVIAAVEGVFDDS